jgi:hypothetical protein
MESEKYSDNMTDTVDFLRSKWVEMLEEKDDENQDEGEVAYLKMVELIQAKYRRENKAKKRMKHLQRFINAPATITSMPETSSHRRNQEKLAERIRLELELLEDFERQEFIEKLSMLENLNFEKLHSRFEIQVESYISLYHTFVTFSALLLKNTLRLLIRPKN